MRSCFMSKKVAILASALLSLSAVSAKATVADGIKLLEAGKIDESVKVLQAAYEAGDADGAFYIGRLFEMGIGTDRDIRRAAALYAAAAGKRVPRRKTVSG